MTTKQFFHILVSIYLPVIRKASKKDLFGESNFRYPDDLLAIINRRSIIKQIFDNYIISFEDYNNYLSARKIFIEKIYQKIIKKQKT